MIKSKLSEEEAVQVGAFVTAQDIPGMVKYLNRVLYDRGLGTDGCSRPMALRDKKDMDEPCFARGYLNKVLEFIEESKRRTGDSDTLEKTVNYLNGLLKEIDRFFYKKKGGIHGRR